MIIGGCVFALSFYHIYLSLTLSFVNKSDTKTILKNHNIVIITAFKRKLDLTKLIKTNDPTPPPIPPIQELFFLLSTIIIFLHVEHLIPLKFSGFHVLLNGILLLQLGHLNILLFPPIQSMKYGSNIIVQYIYMYCTIFSKLYINC